MKGPPTPTVERLTTTVGTAAVLVPLVLLLVTVLGDLGDRTIPCCDYAVLELGTRSFLDGDVWTGLYSREGWRHPGPAPFLWTAPFRLLPGSGFAEHQVAAVALAIAVVSVLLVVVRRRTSPLAYLVACAILCVWILRFDIAEIRQPWNPFTAMWWTMLMATAAMASIGVRGRSGSAWWWVVVAGAGSMAVQSHVGAIPAAFVIFAVGAGIIWHNRRESPPVLHRGPILAGVAVLVVLWGLPMVDLVIGEHNLWRIVTVGSGAAEGDEGTGPWSMVTAALHILALGPADQGLRFGPSSAFTPAPGLDVVTVVLVFVSAGAGVVAIRHRGGAPGPISLWIMSVGGVAVTTVALLVTAEVFFPYLLLPVVGLGVLSWLGISIASAERIRSSSRWVIAAVAVLSVTVSAFSIAGLPRSPLVAEYRTAELDVLLDRIGDNCAAVPEDAIVSVSEAIAWSEVVAIAVALDDCPGVGVRLEGFVGFVAGRNYEVRPIDGRPPWPNVLVMTPRPVQPPFLEVARSESILVVSLPED